MLSAFLLKIQTMTPASTYIIKTTNERICQLWLVMKDLSSDDN